MIVNTEKTGEFIAELRKEKQLTQSQLATAIHVSDKAIHALITVMMSLMTAIIRMTTAIRD